MVTEADIAAATHIRLPTRFSYRNRNGVVDASCIAQANEVLDATITSSRSSGPDFKRLTAVTADGANYVVDLVSNSFDFTDLAPTGAIRGTGSAIVDGVFEVKNARFREIEARIDEGNRLKTEAHASWRNGVNYVSELEAVEDHPVRPGLRSPQIGALHAIAAHWSLSSDPAIIVMPTGS